MMVKRRPRAEQNTPSDRHADDRVWQSKAIWLDGKVPRRFWETPGNRRLYLQWLGHTLGFQSMEDWYRVTTDDFKRHHGAAILGNYWSDSAIVAVKEVFPDYDWKEWLFSFAPRHFWEDPKNHRRYMRWLGQQLDIRRPSDWYRVSNQDFRDHNGGTFLLHYNSTVSLAVMRFLPNYDWKEWLFERTPKGFWRERTNRIRYMTWLASGMGFDRLEDWYSITHEDFLVNSGKHLLTFYNDSPVAAVKGCFPQHSWNEWMFVRTPKGFWDKPKNRRRYMRWLGEKLKIRKPDDWHKLKRSDLVANYGGGLFQEFGSMSLLLKACVPKRGR